MTEDGDSEQQEQPPQATSPQEPKRSFRFTQYQSERELPLIAGLIEKELSEPYLVYTYRFFLNQWPSLCWLAWDESSGEAVGVVVCKVDRHLKGERKMRGYIAMLSVRPDRRGAGIGKKLVKLAIASMLPMNAEEVVLETEADNVASLALYERLGFMREKRLHSFYLNGKDCFRLVLPLPNEVKGLIAASVSNEDPSLAQALQRQAMATLQAQIA